jgi:hypothetical protein
MRHAPPHEQTGDRMTDTDQIELATKTLNTLLDQKEVLTARAARIAKDRQSLAYSASTGTISPRKSVCAN